MTDPTQHTEPRPGPSESPTGPLRAARMARGLSQSEAARELAALGRARQVEVAAPASLKTLLSRWENGHSMPEPQYRALLCELLGRTPAELGFAARPSSGASGLRAGIAAAAAVDAAVLGLWHEQLAVARRLDAELGVAGAGGVVRAQVEQLGRTFSHTLDTSGRKEVGAVLAAAATLAGQQSLDLAEHEQAWAMFDQARMVSSEARLPVASAEAAAGLADVLVDAGEPATALTLLDAAAPRGGAALVRWEAARGQARAAAGAGGDAEEAFAAARAAWPAHTVDVVEPLAVPIELVDLDRWHGAALAALGDPGAAQPLEQALAARPAAARDRAALHADLARALRELRPEAAAEHRRTARELAGRIGAARITARLGAER